jgi:hypothetical protein
MFNLIFEGAQAYNQVGFFLGAVICLGIGGLILGDAFYWRVHAVRASGTIAGVIANNGLYVPVYRYVSPDGQTHLAKSNTGTGSIRGKETGRAVNLLISPHNPAEACDANNYIFDIIGVVMLAPGFVLGYIALTAYPITKMTWIMAAAMILYLAERAYRIIIPRGQRVSISDWRKQLHLDQPIDPAQVKPVESFASTPEARQAQQKQQQAYKKYVPIVAAFAVILISVGVFQSYKISRLQATGLRAEGIVTRLKGEWSSGSSRSTYMYHAVVRFRTDKNVSVEFKDNFGSNPPTHQPGDKVTVLYLSENPQHEAMIDRGFLLNWTIPGIIFLFAAFLVVLALGMRRSAKLQPA